MTAVIPAKPQLPAAIAKLTALATAETFNELSGGVTSGFPVLSFKGKVWRIRKGGEEQMHLDADSNALPTIDVVLVQAHPQPSKIFYDKQYEEGSNEAPRCFSNDGVKPDSSIQAPFSKLCANCPNNVWGSRITQAGKKSRACSDARRMAVVFSNDLLENGDECAKYLLRVPPASLNPLKDYAEKVLAPKGIPFFAVVTRIGFDPQVAHPQLTFKAARFLNEDEAEAIVKLRGSEDVRRILAEAQEFPAAGAANDADESAAAPATPAGSTTASASSATTPAAAKQKASKPRAATEEEAGAAAVAQQPIPPAQPVTPPSDAIAAPPPTRKRKTTAAAQAPAASSPAASATPAEEEEPAPAPASAATASIDQMLDDILNG